MEAVVPLMMAKDFSSPAEPPGGRNMAANNENADAKVAMLNGRPLFTFEVFGRAANGIVSRKFLEKPWGPADDEKCANTDGHCYIGPPDGNMCCR